MSEKRATRPGSMWAHGKRREVRDADIPVGMRREETGWSKGARVTRRVKPQ